MTPPKYCNVSNNIHPLSCTTSSEDIVTEPGSVNVVDVDPNHINSINNLRNKVNSKTFQKCNKINRELCAHCSKQI